MMLVSGRHSQPPNLNEATSYDGWLKRFTLWEQNCGYENDKVASLLIESLGNNCKLKKGLADKFFEKYSIEQMTGSGALELVKTFLKKELAGNDIQKALSKWKDLEQCSRGNGELVEAFIDRFDSAFTTMAAANPGLVMPSEIKAFMLFERSKVSGLEEKMVQSRLDLSKKDTLYDQTELALREVLGLGPGKQTKQEQAFMAIPEGEDCYVINGKKFFSKKRKRKPRTEPSDRDDKQDGKRKNKLGADGHPLKCFDCKSEYHFAGSDRCSKSKKRESESSSDEVMLAQEKDYLLAAGQVRSFTWECRGAAALDSCCTSNVAGQSWLNMYLEELDEGSLRKVEGPFESSRTFGFGNNESLTANVSYKIPAVIAGKKVKIGLDIINSDIPLLLSKSAMKRAGTKLDFKKNTVKMFGKTLPMMTTKSGHPIVRIQPENRDEVFLVSTNIQSHDEQINTLSKLHKQFGHMTKRKFLQFLKTSSVKWMDSLSKDVQNIVDKCEGCILRKRNPDIPAVALPMAVRFNQRVSMDLKHWGDKYILYMVDMWSGYTQGAFINSKKPANVVDSFMKKWVGVYGIPGSILHDLGGEFTADEIKEMTNTLNIGDLSTAAYAPWANGFCEKHHAVTDAVLKSLTRDYPKYSLDVLLAWACMVKNTAYLKNGFSPNQLVFGAGLNLPNVLDDAPSGLKEEELSETFASHLNALNSARISFNRSIADRKIKIALKKKIRTNNTVFYQGDDIFWKRSHEADWRKGKVLQVDNKILWVRGGGNIYRVSINRAIKAPFLFNDTVPEEPEQGDVDPRKEEKEVENEVEEIILEWRDDDLNPFQLQASAPRQVDDDVVEIEDPNLLQELEGSIAAAARADTAITDNQQEQTAAVEGEAEEPPTTENPEATIVHQNYTEDEDNPETGDQIGNPVGDEGGSENRKRRMNVRNARVVKQKGIPNSQPKIHLKARDQIVINMEGEEIQTSVMNRGKLSGQYYNYFNVTDARGAKYNVDLERNEWRRVEVENEEIMMNIIPQHLQAGEDCIRAKQVELDKLNKFKAITEVKDRGQFRISCRWVIWNKIHSDNSQEVRARLVARGYEVEEEVPSDSPTVDQMNLRLVLGIAAANKWRLTSCDVKSAFLQGIKLQREVLMQPPPEAKAGPGTLWKLNVALYGLDEASLQFHFKCKEVFEKLHLKQSKNDPAMFFKCDEAGNLTLLAITHVDDFLLTGNEKVLVDFVRTLSIEFEMGREESWNFKYCGYRIKQCKDTFEAIISQNDYAEEAQIPKVCPARSKEPDSTLTETEKSMLRSIAGKIGWLARGTRPDLLFSQLETSTKFGNPTVRDLKQAVKQMKKVKMHESIIAVKSLGNDPGKWSIAVACDASWKNLNEGTGSTQAGVVFLTNGEVKYPVLWWGNKIKRVCISAMEAELLSMIVAVDQAIYLKQTLQELFPMKTEIPVVVELDNSDCYQMVHANVAAKERRIRAEVARIKDSLNDGNIKEIVLVKGADQISNCLTKANANSDDLLQIFQTGHFK